MLCDEALANLSACLHRELPAADDAQMRQHLAGCAPCREEFENSRAVMRALRRSVPIEPSAKVRAALNDGIRSAIATLPRKGAAEGRRGRPTEGGAGLELLPRPAQPAPAGSPRSLPYPRRRAEARPNSSARLQPVHVAGSPATSGSTRQKKAAQRSLRDRLGIVVLIAALLAVMLVLAARQAASERQSVVTSVAERARRAAAAQRLAERVSAGRTDVLMVKNRFTGEFTVLADASLLPHADSATGEMCLVAYRASDIEKIYADGHVDEAAFANLLKSAACRVEVADGKFTLCPELAEKYIGGDSRASILVLSNRVEIWSSSRLDKYISQGIMLNAAAAGGAPAVNGLPPVK